jgi:tight adherence protein C
MAALFDPRIIATIVTVIAVGAALLSIALPVIDGRGEVSAKRMRNVAQERDRIRARERERLANQQKVNLRGESKAGVKQLVSQFKLKDWLGTETAKHKLVMAGYRTPAAEDMFLIFRGVMPVVLAVVLGFYMLFIDDFGQPTVVIFGIVMLGLYIGIKLPEIYLSNIISKRQFSIKRAFPDALDLMLICVESGVSVENAFRKVSQEIGDQSIELAEELALATAELSYLQDRRSAYENLAKRTGLEIVKSVCTALVQAERYGTPVGTALRVLAQESRDTRMNEAEKKAAALPPMLTVPMIVFFLPVLFVVIMTPAFIQIFGWK